MLSEQVNYKNNEKDIFRIQFHIYYCLTKLLRSSRIVVPMMEITGSRRKSSVLSIYFAVAWTMIQTMSNCLKNSSEYLSRANESDRSTGKLVICRSANSISGSNASSLRTSATGSLICSIRFLTDFCNKHKSIFLFKCWQRNKRRCYGQRHGALLFPPYTVCGKTNQLRYYLD